MVLLGSHCDILLALGNGIHTVATLTKATGLSRARLEPMLRVLYKRGLVGHTVGRRPRGWMRLWAGGEALKEVI